jgi:hypothetical protein
MPWKAIDESGKTHGRLTVIRRSKSKRYWPKAAWLCKCECGKEVTVKGNYLRKGKRIGCPACLHGHSFKDMKIGSRYGRLTIVELDCNSSHGFKWKCKCDCNGNIQSYLGYHLRIGKTKSCGCLHHDIVSLANGLAAKRKLFSHYRCVARQRGYKFNLSFKNLIGICIQPCFYCGKKPEQIYVSRPNTGSFIYNGIDRVNNSQGYFQENCVPCCGSCNRFKMDDSQSVFAEKIKAIYWHFANNLSKEEQYGSTCK